MSVGAGDAPPQAARAKTATKPRSKVPAMAARCLQIPESVEATL